MTIKRREKKMRYALNLEFNGHLNNFGVKQRGQLPRSFPLILKPYLLHLQLNVSKPPTRFFYDGQFYDSLGWKCCSGVSKLD